VREGARASQFKDGWRCYQELPYDTHILPDPINPLLEGYYNLD